MGGIVIKCSKSSRGNIIRQKLGLKQLKIEKVIERYKKDGVSLAKVKFGRWR